MFKVARVLCLKIHVYVSRGLLGDRKYCCLLVKSKPKENAVLRLIKGQGWKAPWKSFSFLFSDLSHH